MSQAEDRSYMTRALELARLGIYSTPPNPAVGCVLVRDGRVVGEGHHRRTGGPHAEVHALEAAGEAARGATAYVNLEPCSHFGRTPPCTRALLTAGVARVVCSLRDPNPRVAGSGLEELARSGVAVESGLLAPDAAELNRGFLRRMSSGRPWVTLKIGASLDGRTALADGVSRWITGEAARADVQRLRARASAVVTGIGTVLADDPELTVRDPGLELLGRRPLRVVLDSRLRIAGDRAGTRRVRTCDRLYDAGGARRPARSGSAASASRHCQDATAASTSQRCSTGWALSSATRYSSRRDPSSREHFSKTAGSTSSCSTSRPACSAIRPDRCSVSRRSSA